MTDEELLAAQKRSCGHVPMVSGAPCTAPMSAVSAASKLARLRDEASQARCRRSLIAEESNRSRPVLSELRDFINSAFGDVLGQGSRQSW